jgi:hypothetical protein
LLLIGAVLAVIGYYIIPTYRGVNPSWLVTIQWHLAGALMGSGIGIPVRHYWVGALIGVVIMSFLAAIAFSNFS